MASDREGRLVGQLRKIAADLSGCDEADLDADTTFLELGFDSLFLTQLATSYGKQLGVEVTFRQLFDELPSIAALAAHVDAALPSDQLPPEATAQGSASSDEGDAAAQTPAPVIPPSVAEVPFAAPAADPAPQPSPPPRAIGTASPGAAVERIFAQQLQLMSEQLALLQNAAAQPAAAAQRPPLQQAAPAPSGPSAGVAADAAPPPPPAPGRSSSAAGAEKAPELKLPAGFGPEASKPGGLRPLPPRQQQHLDSLIETYTRRTAGSKERTQRYRRTHADPRTAAGFNRRWKEMIYPIWVTRSLGSKLWDVDGNEYIDILNGFGPNFLGHSPPFITKALHEQLDRGVEIGPQTPLVGEVSELICQLTGMDRVSFMCTGSEAVQAVKRIARTRTGRDKVVVFSGDYHGNFDQVLVRAANRKDELRTVPLAPGIPMPSVGDTLVLEYGSEQSLELIARYADDIAAVLVEPVQSRRPEFQPREFLHALRKLTAERGICLVFDEVITGFRIEPGGAQAYYGVDADLATYGKVIGGGMPIGVVAGRSQWMDTLDGGHWEYGDTSFPEVGVTFFAGTFVRHPLAIVAARETLRYLIDQGPDLQRRVNAKADRFTARVNALFEQHEIAIEVPHFSSQMYIRVKEQAELSTLLFYHLRNRGVHLLEGFPSYMTDAHSEQDIDHLVAAFTESVERMVEDGIFGRRPATRKQTSNAPFPLTAGQREIWFASQMGDEASCSYNESDTLTFRGPLDERAMVRAVTEVLARHDGLHLRFAADGTTQHVAEDRVIEVPLVDLSALSETERHDAIARFLAEQASTPFDLENGPLVRVTLLKLGPAEHRLVIYGSHLAFDGWSSGVLLGEIGQLYSARVRGEQLQLPEPTSFREYAALESAAAADGTRARATAHWVEQFASGLPEGLDLPALAPRPQQRSFDGGTVKWRLRDSVYRGVKSTAATLNTSMFAVLLAAYKVLLARLSRQNDLVVGVSVAGQAMVEAEALVGHGVNLIPLRVVLDESTPFDRLLRQTKTEVLDLWDHHATTLGDVLSRLNVPRVANRAPLVEAMFNFSTSGNRLRFEGLETSVGENPRRYVNFDLFANLLETDGALTADWDYNAGVYDEASVRRWVGHFETLLESIVEDPSASVGELSLLSEAERARLAHEWNDATRTATTPSCIHELFERQVLRTPDAVAVERASVEGSWGRPRLTYAELEAHSNQLASRLRELGVGPDARVAICLQRSCELLVGVLGVLKAGGAYVPIDPKFPGERVRYMLEDADVRVVVAESATADLLAEHRGQSLILDREGEALSLRASERPEGASSGVRPEHLAYVIYTSGSSGRPKGVEVPHAAVCNFLESMAHQPGFSADDAMMAVTTLSFDIAGLELLLPLSVGGRVVIADSETATDGALLLDAIGRTQCSVMQATPATWRLLIEAGFSRDTRLKVLCGGEALPADLAKELVERSDAVWNMYGPTETTIWSTCHRITGEGPVLVGRPIQNTSIYVLDSRREPVPLGVLGELYIGGAGLARGYHNRDELTAHSFVSDPFSAPGARMYRTGDLARLRPDGVLQVLGRVDDQVKLRGFRIELGEIESVLAELPAVSRAVASVWEAGPADSRLVAYFVPNRGESLDATTLREHLRGRLPEYMMPQHYVALDSVPMTPNGKVARKQLPPPDGGTVASPETYVAPTTPVELRLAELWADALGLERVGAADDFFDLGGHSLLAARMLVRAGREFEVSLGLRSFFSAPTVQGLADLVEAQRYVAGSVAPAGAERESIEL